jgi:hypothetical protein
LAGRKSQADPPQGCAGIFEGNELLKIQRSERRASWKASCIFPWREQLSISLRFESLRTGRGEYPNIARGRPAGILTLSSACCLESPWLGGNSEDMTMLITFETEAYASITMFGDVAVALIKLMGHSGTVPGALLAEDVPKALERLKAAVSANPDATLDPDSGGSAEDEEDRPHVSLAHRALPLIELLSAAAADGKNVMWDS